MNAGGTDGPIGGDWGGDEPWYPERRPITRGTRERMFAVLALAAILGAVILGVVRSVQVSRVKRPQGEGCVSELGQIVCGPAENPLPA